MTAFEIAQIEMMNSERVFGFIQALQGQETLCFEFLTLAIYILFGYLVAAYFTGAHLTKYQLIILNGLYIFCSFALAGSVLQGWLAAVDLQDRLSLLKDSPPADPTLTVGAGWWLFVGHNLCWLGSLFFMWSIRNRAKNDDSRLQTTTGKPDLESALRP